MRRVLLSFVLVHACTTEAPIVHRRAGAHPRLDAGSTVSPHADSDASLGTGDEPAPAQRDVSGLGASQSWHPLGLRLDGGAPSPVTAPEGTGSDDQPCRRQRERCNGVDDDCDGLIDETFPEAGRKCSTALLGACARGARMCVDGALACRAIQDPTPEVCDGIDNDCDGVVDDVLAGGEPSCGEGTVSEPRNYILLVADGCGFAQLAAARMYKNGNTAPLFLETLPVSGEVTTLNDRGETTDSAAAASAMATGLKYPNGAISRRDDTDIETVLEQHKARGKLTGLVTSHTPIFDATPAGFGAHAPSRGDLLDIAGDLMDGSRANVLMGLPDLAISTPDFENAGYTVVTTEEELGALEASTDHVLGLFADGAPGLPGRARFALSYLDRSENGFFLLLETEETDNGGHTSDLPRTIAAVLEFDETVQTVIEWAAARPEADTRVVVTSDHETGGLDLTELDPQMGVVPDDYAFTSNGSHTSRNVPIYVYGGELPAAIIDNTYVFELLGGTPSAQ